MATDERLRREIDQIGRLFGEVVREFDGDEAYELVEEVRRRARELQDDQTGEHRELDELLAGLDPDQLKVVIRAFSTFLELANLAEDRQRIRALRTWEQEATPAPRKESIRAAVQHLASQGMSREQVGGVLERIHAELVFTAHPTEAKRKSIRARLRAIRRLLAKLDSSRLLEREQTQIEAQVRLEIVKMWQTDTIRSMRPTVLQEVQRGLSIQSVLWDTVPDIYADLRSALRESYPESTDEIPNLLRFGSWMGGDRDGHPYVTPDITHQTCLWLRQAALDKHVAICKSLIDSLSISDSLDHAEHHLASRIESAIEQYPRLSEFVEHTAPSESVRRWLVIVRWRLEQTVAESEGGYQSPQQLATDVEAVYEALVETGNTELANNELRRWLDQISVFGFHTARLDIREHSAIYEGVMDEIWRSLNLLTRDEEPSDERRLELLSRTLPLAANLDPVRVSETTRKTLDLFTVIRRLARKYGMQTLGGHIISMTRTASDLLTVLWLWKWSERVDGGDERDAKLLLPVIPLFETIEDLEQAPKILDDALAIPAYREHVEALDNEQIAMLGYSDSTKDGGYLSAAWSLQLSQIELYHLAKEQGVSITFFHGRGGSLGRGGGPAARAILSLPRETFHGSLRLTEQGEVLAERYDDPAIAHRHLEQVLWSIMMATSEPDAPLPEPWLAAMNSMSDASLAVYRDLVDHPSFVDFFRQVTPISEIEQLPIGSRPAKRKGGNRIQDLRAIPWVFSWTQSRCLLPAWFGLGHAIESFVSNHKDGTKQLQGMYKDWPFFRAIVDNSVLAIAKSNMPVFDRYIALADESPGLAEIATSLKVEFERASKMLALTTGTDHVLANVPWLQHSIKVRNRYVDPVNLIQVELLRRTKAAEESEVDSLRRLSQLAIKGVAAGMRTTG